MKVVELQAHKGVESECPENTLSAFIFSIKQGYNVIELDLEYTKDKKIVVLHDTTINRTARNNDGTTIDNKICIHDISYDEALLYDYGIWFSNKFRNEKIPLFTDVLKILENTNVKIKIDNKVQTFPEEILEILFDIINKYKNISITSNNIEFIKYCLQKNNNVNIDYDGEVDEKILIELTNIIKKENLTVWLPYKCEKTKWVKIPFASKELITLVKKYAKVGIWIINNNEDYLDVIQNYSPDIIETNGRIKPCLNKNCLFDMHVHSHNSHDSKSIIERINKEGFKKSLTGIAITDHCDIEYYETIDLDKIIINSLNEINEFNNKNIKLLKGIEIGEGIWNINKTNEIINDYNFDVIIGSIHAVRYPSYTKPYSRIDFSKLDKETIIEYLNQYFIDMEEMILKSNIDILAHLTCPFRYIIGKYGINIDVSIFEEKIRKILQLVINKKISLEINTSCLYSNNLYNNLMPEKWIIYMYKDMGGYLITLASDAHIEENIGNKFNELRIFLKHIGFNNIYYYEERNPIQCSII